MWQTLGKSKWVVYCKRPFAGPKQILSYLANYTHRVAISERRIVAFDEKAHTVTFRWRDYREKNPAAALKTCTLDVDEFLRRFRRHLLPRGFTKVRHYGLLANNARKTLIPQARTAITEANGRKRKQPAAATPVEPPAWPPPCAHCGATHVRCVALIRPDGRRVKLRPVCVRPRTGRPPKCERGREPP